MITLRSTSNYFLNITQISILFLLILLTMSCSKDYENQEQEIYEPPIEELNGLVVNRVDNSPIEGIEMVLVTKWGLFEGESISTLTNKEGNFNFYEGGSLKPSGKLFQQNYQSNGISINDKPNKEELDVTSIFGVPTEFNSDEPMEIKFGLYPETYFRLHTTNVAPANESDSLKFTFDNGYPSSEQNQIGILDDIILTGKTKYENVVTINYDVVHDGITESFQRIVECVPSDTTDIYLEY
jgi:hypothetical protein